MLQPAGFSVLQKVYDKLAGRGLSRIVPGGEAVYDFFFRLVCRNMKSVEVQGSKMVIDLADPDPSMRRTFRAYAMQRAHETATTELFRRLVGKGATVLDLGANIGYFTLLAAQMVGPTGRVFAFEPEPRNFRYLQQNVKLNGYDQVTTEQKAVTDRTGSLELFLCPYDTGHHTIQQYDGIRSYRPDLELGEPSSIAIEAVCLDDYFAGRLTPIDVIKMDVEGAERLALAGMERLIEANDRLVMILEFFPLLLKKMGTAPEDLARRLLDLFEVYVVGHDYSMSTHSILEGDHRIMAVDQLMAFCQEDDDHLNLFLKRT